MSAFPRMIGLSLVFLAAVAVAQNSEFTWQWRNQEVIGREDASVGNTSKLTEPERSSLIDAIVLRLQKPMGDAGYDDDRIREIASTTRIRFVDAGTGEPLILTTSIGLEGGCDALANCPLWVFRRTDDGFVSLLNTIAASYTPQPGEAGFEVVFMHHVSEKESGLAVYRFDGNNLDAIGCYTALWPKHGGDPAQLSDPKIEACPHPPLVESARPAPPDTHIQTPATAEPAQPAPAAEPPATQPKPDNAATEPAAPAPEAPKTEQPQNAPDQPQPSPPPEQAQPAQQPPSEQPPPDVKEQTPKPDQSQSAPPAEQESPAQKQDAPKADEAQPSQSSPDTSQAAPEPQQPEPPAKQDQAAPDAKQDAPKQDQPANPDSTQPQPPQP